MTVEIKLPTEAVDLESFPLAVKHKRSGSIYLFFSKEIGVLVQEGARETDVHLYSAGYYNHLKNCQEEYDLLPVGTQITITV